MTVWGEVELEKVKSALSMFCTKHECACEMGISDSEFEKLCTYHLSDEFDHTPTYDEIEDRYYSIGRANLKKAQYQAMLDGDRSMLIALGKEYLGQTGEAKEPPKVKKESALGNMQQEFAAAPGRRTRASH